MDVPPPLTPARPAIPAISASAPGSDPLTVSVVGPRPPGLLTLLDRAGVRRVPRDGGVVVVGSLGEPDRMVTHDLVRTGRRHLLLRYLDDAIVVGPYVEPGRTACLECLDEHDDTAFPRPIRRPVGLPAAVDVTTSGGFSEPVAALAAAWLACDIARLATGEPPLTWSTTVEIGAGLGAVTVTAWLRHPTCSCGWLDPSATMEE